MITQKLVDDIQRAIKDSVQILSRSQKSNGQFVGLASPDPNDFSLANQHQTTFFTSLIVMSLESLPDSSVLKTKAAQFILNERSPAWSWNYWLKDCADYKLRPYPDDLDDTACALTALIISEPATLSQESLANFAKHLISQESKPGGPYSTWLVASTAKEVWRDLDIAVNANIGNFLGYQDIVLAGIEEFVTDKIMSDSLVSKYYLTEIPVIYFLARSYKGPANLELRAKVEGLLSNFSELNDLHLSMLLTAALRLKSTIYFEPMILELLKRKSDYGWAAQALYYEPDLNGVKYFAGSADLTTAMACEALQAIIDSASIKSKAKVKGLVVRDEPIARIDTLATDIETRYQEYLETILNRDMEGQITKIASLTAKSLNSDLAGEIIVNLNQASLNGWASYTLFDNFLDDDEDPDKLPMAMLGLRRAGAHFRKALPNNQEFAAYVETVLDIVDNANNWELANCRIPKSLIDIGIQDLPDFSDLSHLAYKSWGHTIASSGVMLASGHSLNSQAQSYIQKFFYHYLIARQLNDDAHDWLSDLNSRQLSFVVTKILRDYMKALKIPAVHLSTKDTALKTFFWEHTIVMIVDLINQNLELARNALASCHPIKDRSIFLDWLDEIQSATDKAANSRIEARNFIKSFSA